MTILGSFAALKEMEQVWFDANRECEVNFRMSVLVGFFNVTLGLVKTNRVFL